MAKLSDLLITIQGDNVPFTENYGAAAVFRKKYAILVAKNLNTGPVPEGEPDWNYIDGIQTIQQIQVPDPESSYGPVLVYLFSRMTAVAGATPPFIVAYNNTETFDEEGKSTAPPHESKIPAGEIRKLPLFIMIREIFKKLKAKEVNVMSFFEMLKICGPAIGNGVKDSSGFNSETIFDDIVKVVGDSIKKAGGNVPDLSQKNVPPLYNFFDDEPQHHESEGTGLNGEPLPTVMEALEMRWILAVENAISPELDLAYGIQPFAAPGFIIPMSVEVIDDIMKGLGVYDGPDPDLDENETILLWESLTSKDTGQRLISDADITKYVNIIKSFHIKLLDALQADVTSHLVNKLNEGNKQIFATPPTIPPPYAGPISVGQLSQLGNAEHPPVVRALFRWSIAHLPIVDIRLGFTRPLVSPVP